MSGLTDFRSKHPEYNDMDDVTLATALHDKFYSDIPKDEYFKQLGLQSLPSNKPSTMEAVGRAGTQGLGLTWTDEAYALGAGVRAAGQNVANSLGFDVPRTTGFKQNYREAEEEIRAKNDAARKAHPVAYGVSEAVGSIAPTIALPAAKVFQGAGTAAKIGNAALTGGYQGAIQGAGTSDADNIGDLAKDTAIGGTIGGAFSGGSEGLASLAQKSLPYLKQLSTKFGFQTLGGQKAQINKLLNDGYSPEEIEELVQHASNENILSPNSSKMVNKLQESTSSAQQEMNELFQMLDEKNISNFTPKQIIDKIESLKKQNAVQGLPSGQFNAALDKFKQLVENHSAMSQGVTPSPEAVAAAKEAAFKAGDPNWSSIMNKLSVAPKINPSEVIPLSQARKLKGEIGEEGMKAGRSLEHPTEEAAHAAYGPVAQAIKENIASGAPESLDKYLGLNRKMELNNKIESLLKNKVSGEIGNNYSLTDYGLMGLGGATGSFSTDNSLGGGLTGVAIGNILSKGRRKYGTYVGKQITDKLSNTFKNINPDIAGKSGNILSKPIIGMEQEDTNDDYARQRALDNITSGKTVKTQYGIPDQQTVEQFTPPEMQDKPKWAIINQLNQTNPEFRNKAKNKDEDDENL